MYILESIQDDHGYSFGVRSRTDFYVGNYESIGNEDQLFYYFIYRKGKDKI
jgi:hypothetical protein